MGVRVLTTYSKTRVFVWNKAALVMNKLLGKLIKIVSFLSNLLVFINFLQLDQRH